jgi:hypothetical protein
MVNVSGLWLEIARWLQFDSLARLRAAVVSWIQVDGVSLEDVSSAAPWLLRVSISVADF